MKEEMYCGILSTLGSVPISTEKVKDRLEFLYPEKGSVDLQVLEAILDLLQQRVAVKETGDGWILVPVHVRDRLTIDPLAFREDSTNWKKAWSQEPLWRKEEVFLNEKGGDRQGTS